jgi:hypothetical protein
VSNTMVSLMERSTGWRAGVVAAAALAQLLRSRRSTWERVSSAPPSADDESDPMVSPAQVVNRLVFREGPGSAIEA